MKNARYNNTLWFGVKSHYSHLHFEQSKPLVFSFTNGTYTGVLAEIVYGRADVSFNSRFLNDPTKDKAYRYSNTYGLDFICFVVPRDEPLPRMQTIWKTFSLEVWLCVAVTYALMTKSFQLYNKFNLFGGRKIPDPFMTSLQVKMHNGYVRLCWVRQFVRRLILKVTPLKRERNQRGCCRRLRKGCQARFQNFVVEGPLIFKNINKPNLLGF